MCHSRSPERPAGSQLRQSDPRTRPSEADVRAVDSVSEIGIVTSLGMVNTNGLTLDALPSSAAGGGLNASVREGTISLMSPLAAGASVNIVFRIDIVLAGGFRYFVAVEAAN